MYYTALQKIMFSQLEGRGQLVGKSKNYIFHGFYNSFYRQLIPNTHIHTMNINQPILLALTLLVGWQEGHLAC